MRGGRSGKGLPSCDFGCGRSYATANATASTGASLPHAIGNANETAPNSCISTQIARE